MFSFGTEHLPADVNYSLAACNWISFSRFSIAFKLRSSIQMHSNSLEFVPLCNVYRTFRGTFVQIRIEVVDSSEYIWDSGKFHVNYLISLKLINSLESFVDNLHVFLLHDLSTGPIIWDEWPKNALAAIAMQIKFSCPQQWVLNAFDENMYLLLKKKPFRYTTRDKTILICFIWIKTLFVVIKKGLSGHSEKRPWS